MSSSVVAKLLSLSGLIGSSPSTNTLIPPSRNSPRSIEDFQRAGDVDNPDIWSSYNSAMARPRTLEEQLRMWDEMAHWDLLAAALAEITEEATQEDSYSPALIWYECNDVKARDDVEQMLLDVNAAEYIRSQVWHVAGYGNSFEKLDYAPGDGVKGFNAVHPLEIRRYWLKRNRRCVGFRWQGGKPSKETTFNLGNSIISQAKIKSGSTSSGAQEMEQLWYPWDFLHFRRMYRHRQSEHGEPLFEEAQSIYKKLRIALDQMVVHRAQIQPDRYVINIDVKDMPPLEQMKVVNRWKQALRSKLSFGSGASGINGQPDEFRSFYNPMALDTVLWMAKPRDFGHSIEKIAGTASVPDVHDIEMLTNLFFSIIGMPKSWVGFGDSAGKEGGGPASGKALLAQDMKFLRKIKSIRHPITSAYTWLGYFHLLLKGYDISKIELRACMPPLGSLEDSLKLELLDKQADLLAKLGDVMDKYNLPREAWIDLVFKKYLHLPSEIVDVFMTALPAEMERAPQESARRKKSDTTPEKNSASGHFTAGKILEEINRKIGPEKISALSDIQDVLHGSIPVRNIRFRTATDVLKPAILQENDLIVSGFGMIDPVSDFKPTKDTNITESFVNHPGYRGAMNAHLGKK